jgi:hypothetical protein
MNTLVFFRSPDVPGCCPWMGAVLITVTASGSVMLGQEALSPCTPPAALSLS